MGEHAYNMKTKRCSEFPVAVPQYRGAESPARTCTRPPMNLRPTYTCSGSRMQPIAALPAHTLDYTCYLWIQQTAGRAIRSATKHEGSLYARDRAVEWRLAITMGPTPRFTCASSPPRSLPPPYTPNSDKQHQPYVLLVQFNEFPNFKNSSQTCPSERKCSVPGSPDPFIIPYGMLGVAQPSLS